MNSFLIFILAILLSSDRISYLRMLELGNSVLARLKLEPVSAEITELINRLQSVLGLYALGISKWQADVSRSTGKVDTFAKLLLTIPFVIDSFKSEVKILMPGNSTVLLVLFGTKISKFYTGSQGKIIKAFENLLTLLNDYPELAPLKIKVQAFILQLNGSYELKRNIKDNVKIDSTSITTLHQLLGRTLLGVFGQLIFIFQATPLKVASFFDSTIMKYRVKDPTKLRTNQARVQVPVDATKNASNVKTITKGYIVLESETNAIVCVWTASSEDAPMPVDVLEIPAYGKVTAKVTNLGSALNTFLLFRVKEGTVDGLIKTTVILNKPKGIQTF